MSRAIQNLEKLRRTNIIPGLVFGSDAAKATNAATIQAAIDALASSGSNDAIVLPGGLIYSGKILRRGRVGIIGMGELATTLMLGNGVNDNLIVDERWENSVLFAQDPFYMADLTLDGNRANNSAGSCYVGQTYWSTFERVRYQNAAGRGCQISTVAKSGSNIANSVADNRWESCRFFNNAQGGWHARDVADLLADQRLIGCDFDSNGSATFAQLINERFSGCVIQECRFYGGFAGGDADLSKFGISQVLGNHFELAAKSSPNTSTIIPSLRVRSWSGPVFRWGVISDNLFWMQATNKTATDIYCGVYFDQVTDRLMLTSNVFQAVSSIAVKRAVHGALGMAGTRYPNVFSGYTVGTEYGDAWNNWGSTTLPPAANDPTTTQALVNAIRTLMINEGVSR